MSTYTNIIYDAETIAIDREFEEIERHEQLLHAVKHSKNKGLDDHQTPIYLGWLTGCETMYSHKPEDWTKGIEEAEKGFFKKIWNFIMKILTGIKNFFMKLFGKGNNNVIDNYDKYAKKCEELAHKVNYINEVYSNTSMSSRYDNTITISKNPKTLESLLSENNFPPIDEELLALLNTTLKELEGKAGTQQLSDNILGRNEKLKEFTSSVKYFINQYEETDIFKDGKFTSEGEIILSFFDDWNALSTLLNNVVENVKKVQPASKELGSKIQEFKKILENPNEDVKVENLKKMVENLKIVRDTVIKSITAPLQVLRAAIALVNEFCKETNIGASLIQQIKHALHKNDLTRARSIVIVQLGQDRYSEPMELTINRQVLPSELFDSDNGKFQLLSQEHWNSEYWSTIRNEMRVNFSEKKLDHAIEVMRYLRNKGDEDFISINK